MKQIKIKSKVAVNGAVIGMVVGFAYALAKDKNKLILESVNEDSFDEDEFLDFRKINESLGDMDDQLSKLLGD